MGMKIFQRTYEAIVMNYFGTFVIVRPFRRPRKYFVVLFNPPAALYLYETEDRFYTG